MINPHHCLEWNFAKNKNLIEEKCLVQRTSNFETLPIGKPVVIPYSFSTIACMHFRGFQFEFLHDFCIILNWNPWRIRFLNFCICIPHKIWIWASNLGVFWGENGSQPCLESSACMNLVHFHVQIHLGPPLGQHRPNILGIQSILEPLVGIHVPCKNSEKEGPWGPRPTTMVGRPWGSSHL